ncbi:uncharacterized protein OCT59_004886 [Rhizophagus irregularis]|uniref:uncharacterized protein n=1 Tax=Rhizophagus irregularis TaxID=588596 RepID=UPI00331E45D6|nr:hypothetical protein OCT59_004886 [Rhizophagus irregularis]
MHTSKQQYSTKLLEEVLLNLFFIFPWVSGFDMGPQILKTKKKVLSSAPILMYFRTLENSSNLEIRNPRTPKYI